MALLPETTIGSTDLEQIIRGESVRFRVQLVRDRTGLPVDLTTASAGSYRMGNADGTIMAKQLGAGLSVLDGPTGLLEVDLATTDTAALLVGDAVGAELTITAVETTIVQLSDIQVSDRIFV